MATLRGTILGASALLFAGCPAQEEGGPIVSGSSASVGMTTSGNDSSPGSDTDATSAQGSSSATGGDVSTTGGDVPDTYPTCMEFAAWASSCPGTDPLEELLALCNDIVSQSYADNEECGAAYEAAFGCLTGQDCSAADLSEPPEACAGEGQAVEAACNFATGTTGTSTG